VASQKLIFCKPLSGSLYHETKWPLSGIKETYLNNSISVYPNPATSHLTLELQPANTLHNIMINMYDLQGKLLLQQPLQQQKTEINISDLSRGLYLLQVTCEEGAVVKKFIRE
jgi:hypothetical protein